MVFFISGKKFYATKRNEVTDLYNEFTLRVNSDGAYEFKQLETGLKSKPKDRQLCTYDEVIAQLGGEAIPYAVEGDEVATAAENTKK